jgi:hypothetical protein
MSKEVNDRVAGPGHENAAGERGMADSDTSETEAGLVQTVDEAKLVRKLDLHLIPLIMALYLFSFLDR